MAGAGVATGTASDGVTNTNSTDRRVLLVPRFAKASGVWEEPPEELALALAQLGALWTQVMPHVTRDVLSQALGMGAISLSTLCTRLLSLSAQTPVCVAKTSKPPSRDGARRSGDPLSGMFDTLDGMIKCLSQHAALSMLEAVAMAAVCGPITTSGRRSLRLQSIVTPTQFDYVMSYNQFQEMAPSHSLLLQTHMQ